MVGGVEAIGTGVSAMLVSCALVGVVRHFALRLSLLDVPTFRSSHAIPTPRGGGAGAVTAAISITVAVAPVDQLTLPVWLGFGAVVATSVIGWIDDRHSASVGTRLGFHIFSAVLLLPLALTGVANPLLAVVLAVWWTFLTVAAINVLNFMDGIDGIIGLQALVLGAHYTLLSPAGALTATLGISIAGAAAGFLIWNSPSAKIFLGDVGSGGLGVLGVLGGILLIRFGLPFLRVFLPLYPLCLDSALTIIDRWRRGENLTEAHRSHLYQRLANGKWTHGQVSLGYAVAAAVGSAISILCDGIVFAVVASAYVILVLAIQVLARNVGSSHVMRIEV